MAESFGQGLFFWFGAAVILLFVVFKVFQKSISRLRNKFFAWFVFGTMEDYNILNHERKKTHFKPLEDVISKAAALKNEGKFSLLEVGVGAGANLKYYPSNCVLTVVDPNPYFEEYFRKNHQEKFKDMEVERFVIGYGEDMKEIPDNSIDVVVTTVVMCSVRDTDAVLKEIKRVLVPGGKFYFWEHVADQDGTRMHRLQRILNPMWPYVFDGCEVTRKTADDIRKAGFSEVDVEDFYVKCPPGAPLMQRFFFDCVIGSHIRGVAKK